MIFWDVSRRSVRVTVHSLVNTITVTHWGSAFYGAPYAVAMEKGFFKKYGVDITGVLTSQGGGTSVRNTPAGDLPYGEVALAAAVEAINNGVPLRIIGSGAQSIADILWMAKKGSPLHSIEDLAGKTVAFTAPGSVTNMLILMSMKKKAIDPNAVKLVPAGGIGANVSAVLNNAVDAGMCGEPVWSENEDKLQPVFWPKDILSPNMMQTVAVTTADYAKDGSAKLRGIIAGRRDGVRYIEAHPGGPLSVLQIFRAVVDDPVGRAAPAPADIIIDRPDRPSAIVAPTALRERPPPCRRRPKPEARRHQWWR